MEKINMFSCSHAKFHNNPECACKSQLVTCNCYCELCSIAGTHDEMLERIEKDLCENCKQELDKMNVPYDNIQRFARSRWCITGHIILGG